MKYYYANAENKPTGPVDLAELNRLASLGTINDKTSVIPEGSHIWTTYASVKESAGTAAVADLVTAKTNQVVTAAQQYSWGSFFFALLLILIEWFRLPWTVLRRAGIELAEWGTQRTLPTASSDQPVLTYVCIALKPFIHVLFTVAWVVSAVRGLFGAGPLYHVYESYRYSFSMALAAFFSGLLVAYFGNIVVAVLFELWGLFIRVANDVKRMAGRI